MFAGSVSQHLSYRLFYCNEFIGICYSETFYPRDTAAGTIRSAIVTPSWPEWGLWLGCLSWLSTVLPDCSKYKWLLLSKCTVWLPRQFHLLSWIRGWHLVNCVPAAPRSEQKSFFKAITNLLWRKMEKQNDPRYFLLNPNYAIVSWLVLKTLQHYSEKMAVCHKTRATESDDPLHHATRSQRLLWSCWC